MHTMHRPFLLASALLALPIGQAVLADSEPTTPLAADSTTQLPATPRPPIAPIPRDARAEADTRMEERNQRYQALRASAAEVGLDLPESPPWEQSPAELFTPPVMPSAPTDPAMTAQDIHAWREQMRALSAQERQALRETYWEQMREDAAKRDIELPESAPWITATKRREESVARYERYREIVDQMSPEQREAAQALFGMAPAMPSLPTMPPCMTQPGYGYSPTHGGYDGPATYPLYPRAMPYQGGSSPYVQGPPPPSGWKN